MKKNLFRLFIIVSGTLVAAVIGGIGVFLCRFFGLGVSKPQGEAAIFLFALFGLANGIYSALALRGASNSPSSDAGKKGSGKIG